MYLRKCLGAKIGEWRGPFKTSWGNYNSHNGGLERQLGECGNIFCFEGRDAKGNLDNFCLGLGFIENVENLKNKV